jgi:hypothetical protein
MVSAGVLSGDDVRRLLENTTALLTAAGAVDFDDGQTIAEKIAATPDDFMTWSRKRTSTRKVAVGVISVCKALAGLEDALTGMRGYTPAVASPPIGIHLLTPPVAHPLEQLTTVNLAPYTSKPKTRKAPRAQPAAQPHFRVENWPPLASAVWEEAWRNPLAQTLLMIYCAAAKFICVGLPRVTVWFGLALGLCGPLLCVMDPATAADIICAIARVVPHYGYLTVRNIVLALGQNLRANIVSTSHCLYDPTSAAAVNSVANGMPTHQPSVPTGPDMSHYGPCLVILVLVHRLGALGGGPAAAAAA